MPPGLTESVVLVALDHAVGGTGFAVDAPGSDGPSAHVDGSGPKPSNADVNAPGSGGGYAHVDGPGSDGLYGLFDGPGSSGEDGLFDDPGSDGRVNGGWSSVGPGLDRGRSKSASNGKLLCAGGGEPTGKG